MEVNYSANMEKKNKFWGKHIFHLLLLEGGRGDVHWWCHIKSIEKSFAKIFNKESFKKSFKEKFFLQKGSCDVICEFYSSVEWESSMKKEATFSFNNKMSELLAHVHCGSSRMTQGEATDFCCYLL